MTELERKVQVLDPEPAAKQQDQSSEAESNSSISKSNYNEQQMYKKRRIMLIFLLFKLHFFPVSSGNLNDVGNILFGIVSAAIKRASSC